MEASDDFAVIAETAKHMAKVPLRITFEVEGLDFETWISLEYDTDARRHEVVEVRHRRRPGGKPLLARGLRDTQQEATVVSAIQRASERVVADARTDDPFAFIGTGSKVTESFARALARGRSKRSDSVALDRASVVREYRALRESGEASADIYKEVAQRLGMGRTTVYEHLRRAGEVGKGKR